MKRHCVAIGTLLVIIATILFIPSVSQASPGSGIHCAKSNAKGICIIFVHGPGGGGGSGGGASGSVGCLNGKKQIPCSTADGVWSASRGCYVQQIVPSPGPDDPRWNMHFVPGNYLFSCLIGTGGSYFSTPAATPQPANPAVLARQAEAAMKLHAITIGIAPRAVPSYGFVGLPVWMWATRPGASTVGPISRSASAGGVTVTAKASVTEVDWSMGDGHSVRCDGAGTPYDVGYGNRMSPDCGYRYTEPSTAHGANGTYKVTATSHWTITWAGGGATGQQNLTFAAAAQVQIRELQVVVTH